MQGRDLLTDFADKVSVERIRIPGKCGNSIRFLDSARIIQTGKFIDE
jgi:hypothetical protein